MKSDLLQVFDVDDILLKDDIQDYKAQTEIPLNCKNVTFILDRHRDELKVDWITFFRKDNDYSHL